MTEHASAVAGTTVTSAAALQALVAHSNSSVFIWRTMPRHEFLRLLRNPGTPLQVTGELWLTNSVRHVRQFLPRRFAQGANPAAVMFEVPRGVYRSILRSAIPQHGARANPLQNAPFRRPYVNLERLQDLPRSTVEQNIARGVTNFDHNLALRAEQHAELLNDNIRNIRLLEPVENVLEGGERAFNLTENPAAFGKHDFQYRFHGLDEHGEPIIQRVGKLRQFVGKHGVKMTCIAINVALFTKAVVDSIADRDPRDAVVVATSMAASLLVGSQVVAEAVQATAAIEAFASALTISAEAAAGAATFGIALAVGLVVDVVFYLLWPKQCRPVFPTTVRGPGPPPTKFDTSKLNGVPTVAARPSVVSVRRGAPSPLTGSDKRRGAPTPIIDTTQFHQQEQVDVVEASEIEPSAEEVPLAAFMPDEQDESDEVVVLTTSRRLFSDAFELNQVFEIDNDGEFVQYRTTNLVSEEVA